jgi:hypothetical protein
MNDDKRKQNDKMKDKEKAKRQIRNKSWSKKRK